MRTGLKLLVAFTAVTVIILSLYVPDKYYVYDNNDLEIENSEELLENYEGLYYLHDDLPEHGQDQGNTHDVGDLLKDQPHGNEERYCAKWVQFDFDEHVKGEYSNDESFYIKNIYFHIWWKSANLKAEIGIDIHSSYDYSLDYFFETTKQESITTVGKNGYWLTTKSLEINSMISDIHDLTVKLKSIDALPSVYSGINQYSFIILNLEDDEILKSNDKDNDGLNDFDELYSHFTNPEDFDTDDDGLTDIEEAIEGKDGVITNPNNFDIDNDDLIDGDDPDPFRAQYRQINEEWVIKGQEFLIDDGLMVNDNIIISAGGKLTIKNTILKMNQNGEQYSIKVEKGAELIIEESVLITNAPDHWYSMTLQTDHWHEEYTIEIYGKAIFRHNKIDYGGMIYIRSSNDTIIEGNTISHYYYGIMCSYSSPTIIGNTITPFIGNGIFLWHSSPQIEDTVIKTYIGTGISFYYSSPLIINCSISGGSNDFFLSSNSHPMVTNSIYNEEMIHFDDAQSSILVGSIDTKDVANNNGIDVEKVNNNKLSSRQMTLIFFIIIAISIIVTVKLFYSNIENKPDLKVKSEERKVKKKHLKIRPKNSWKRRRR
jgi:parallel beta-helix repeat protein